MNMLYDNIFSEDTRSFFRSPVRDIFKRVDLNAIYSFAGGYPSAETFPLEEIERTMSEVIEKYAGKAFQYGATQGVPELREAVARRYGVPVERVQITSSSQQGIDVCTRVLPRSISALERNAQVPAPTPHKILGPGIDGRGIPRGPRATRMGTGLS